MAEIKPFMGITYNQIKIHNLSSVIAPPYDVISEEAKKKLYQNNPYNIIRIIKGKTTPNDVESENQYTRAKDFLESWLKKGIFQKDDTPCLYAMEDEFTIPGCERKAIRHGFMTLVKLEEFGKGCILPHEKTLSKPKVDRLRLMKACKANLSPIFALYSDPDRIINSLFQELKSTTEPFIDLLSSERIVHRVYKISSPQIIQKVAEQMKKKSILIADGHHRYETALNYYQQMESSENNQKNTDYSHIMMYLANMDDPGLTILAYHRLLKNLPKENMKSWERKISPFFRIESFPFDGLTTTGSQAREKLFHQLAEKGRKAIPSFGLYAGDKRYYLLVLKDSVNLQSVVPEDQPLICKQLDVTILDHLIINKIINSNECLVKENFLGFSHNHLEAISAVNSDKCQMALFLNPTKIHQVNKIAALGQKMPQKSTFFYPKLPTGLILRKIED